MREVRGVNDSGVGAATAQWAGMDGEQPFGLLGDLVRARTKQSFVLTCRQNVNCDVSKERVEIQNLRRQYHSRKVGQNLFTLDVHRLIHLSKSQKVLPVPLSEISEVDENWWSDDPENLPTPRSLADHMALVEHTDLAHPILLCVDGRLMDGMHRVVKALLENRTHVLAVRSLGTPEPDYVNVSVDDLPYPDEET